MSDYEKMARELLPCLCKKKGFDIKHLKACPAVFRGNVIAALEQAYEEGRKAELIAEAEEAAVEQIQADERRKVYEEFIAATEPLEGFVYLSRAIKELRRICGLGGDDD